MKLRRNARLLQGAMDMTPLIDVIFLLLIFFMLSRSFILQPGLKIESPKSLYGTGIRANHLMVAVMLEPERKDPATGMGLKRQPLIFYNDQLMTLEGLKVALASVSGSRNGFSIVIKADQEVPHGLVVSIMNIALGQGLSVVLATQGGGRSAGLQN